MGIFRRDVGEMEGGNVDVPDGGAAAEQPVGQPPAAGDRDRRQLPAVGRHVAERQHAGGRRLLERVDFDPPAPVEFHPGSFQTERRRRRRPPDRLRRTAHRTAARQQSRSNTVLASVVVVGWQSWPTPDVGRRRGGVG